MTQLDFDRKWLARDRLHCDNAWFKTAFCFVFVDPDKNHRCVVENEDGFRGLLQPSSSVYGVQLNISHYCSRIHWGLASKSFIRDCNADLHIDVEQQHGWKTACCVHIRHLEKFVPYS